MTSSARGVPLDLAIDTDRLDVADPLDRLVRAVAEGGGGALPGTRICVRQGEITIRRPRDRDSRQRLLQVPYACMPDLASYRVRLDRGGFEADRDPAGPTPTGLQDRAFRAMLDLYNRLDKPAQWQRRSPWLTLWRDPGLLTHLVNPARPWATGDYRLYRAGWRDGLAVSSFFAARAFTLTIAGLVGPRKVLMPLLDGLNHHADARRFQHLCPDTGGDGGLYVHLDRPVAGSDECFVRYSRLDRQAAMMTYGFADPSARVLFSQPMRFDLGCGLPVQILPNVSRCAGPLAPEVAGLEAYMPRVMTADPDSLTVSRLAIPPVGEGAGLLRVLEALIAGKRRAWRGADVGRAARAAARVVIATNRRYHARTAALVQAARRRGGSDPPAGRAATLAAVDAMAAANRAQLAACAEAAGV